MSNGSEHLEERTWLQPGDRVRLTGEDWIHLGMHGQTVRVVDIDLDGDPLIEDPNGGMLAVYSKPGEGDYSAERVEAEPDPWAGFTGESPEDAAYAQGWNDACDHDTYGALRDRIVALEAVIAGVKSEIEGWTKFARGDLAVQRIERMLSLAPSTVLDQVIREAKAEAGEAARDAIMPPVNWNLRPDGTEMPGTEHIDGALHDIHVQLTQMATEIRNGDA